MFKHLFKLIWNKKKQNFLLMSEILVSFLVIFAVFTLVVYYYHNYKKPMGIDYQDVWVVNYSNAYQTKNTDSPTGLLSETCGTTIKAMPQDKRNKPAAAPNVAIYPVKLNTRDGMTYKGNRRVDDNNWYTVDDNYLRMR